MLQDSTKGLNPRNVSMIGHGIGAHICGVASLFIGNIGRITGKKIQTSTGYRVSI